MRRAIHEKVKSRLPDWSLSTYNERLASRGPHGRQSSVGALGSALRKRTSILRARIPWRDQALNERLDAAKRPPA
jgi:hypothetical protein